MQTHAKMATKEENISRKEAIRRAVRSLDHDLRQVLQSDIKAFNSRLYSKFMITEDVRAKADIDETLSAIRARLDNDAVTETTFDDFVEAIGERASRKHLKDKLLELVDQQMKGEPVYLMTPSLQASSSGNDRPLCSNSVPIPTATHGAFSENHDTSSSPARHKQAAEMEDRRFSGDSALGRVTDDDFDGDEDELPPGHVQASDHATDNNPMVPVTSPSGIVSYPQMKDLEEMVKCLVDQKLKESQREEKMASASSSQQMRDLESKIDSIEEKQKQCNEELRMTLKEEQKRRMDDLRTLEEERNETVSK